MVEEIINKELRKFYFEIQAYESMKRARILNDKGLQYLDILYRSRKLFLGLVRGI